nr:K(+) efflux antiporter 4-like [Ipomoea batatas]
MVHPLILIFAIFPTVVYGGEAFAGVFVGVLLSTSSTKVVLKFLMERKNIGTLYGQVTIGTLVLQDCTVGLLFALLPILGGTFGVLLGLAAFFSVLSIFCRTFVPRFLKLMISLSSQTHELYQLASIASACLLPGVVISWVLALNWVLLLLE